MDARLRVLALVTNIPGPLAAATLVRDGAAVVKVEPPQGDALEAAAPEWCAAVTSGMEVLRLDLKSAAARESIAARLAQTDVLVTAMRATALERLGLSRAKLRENFPRLCHVAISGEAAPNDDRAGHDLTYQAQAGLLDPPAMPRSVFADLFAAERAVAAAYQLLFERERSGSGGYAQIAIAQGASELADALRFGLTTADGPLGGRLPIYRMYETRDGWIALAALEPHFRENLARALQLQSLDAQALSACFAEHANAYWEDLAQRYDLPLCAVQSL